MMQKVLITGASGLVGSRLTELLAKDFQIITPDEKELDILNFSAVADFLDSTKPDTIIHCAAYTDVTATESQRGDTTAIAYRLNVDATENLAELCNQKNIFLVYISTDYIFSGNADKPGPYIETTVAHPQESITWYGWTKALGEEKIRPFLNTSIVRIAFPINPDPHPKLDLAHRIIKLYDGHRLYPMVTDQFLSCTYVDDLALALRKIIIEHKADIFHITSSDTFTPYNFAQYLIEQARNQKDVIEPITLDQLKIKTGNSRYPQFGGLDVRATEKELGLRFKTWKEIISHVLV